MASMQLYVSKKTLMMLDEERDAAIKRYSTLYKISEKLIRAVISVESDKVPVAIRLEPHLKEEKWYQRLIPRKYKNDPYAYCSIGYMQTLYGIARHYGFKGSPLDMVRADVSIKFGVRHLKELFKRYTHLHAVISAYNQGSPRRFKKGHPLAGKYRNHKYVSAVVQRMDKVIVPDPPSTSQPEPPKEKPKTPPVSDLAALQPPKRSWLVVLLSRLKEALC